LTDRTIDSTGSSLELGLRQAASMQKRVAPASRAGAQRRPPWQRPAVDAGDRRGLRAHPQLGAAAGLIDSNADS
jgi:hypothetical protein